MTASSTLPDWLAAAMVSLQAGDIDGYMAMYAEDAVHEFPFAPEGAVERLAGRDTIASYMRQLPSMIHFGSLSDVRVREVGDETIVEATGHHSRVADGAARLLSYVWIITRRDGQVVQIRDYMNPLQLMAM